MTSSATLCRLLALASCGVACAPSVSPPPAQEHAAHHEQAANERRASLEPPEPTAPEPQPRRAQPVPPAEARELASLFQDVCQLAALPDAPDGVPGFGCACCAPFDGCKPSDPPFSVDQQVYFPTSSVSGAFTRAGADQRALPMIGCEPHSENYGGLVVLERKAERFVVERYISGLNPGRCWAVRRDDARDLLLCTQQDVHQGSAQGQLLQLDLSQSDEQLLASPPLLDVGDNELSGCWSELGVAVSSIQMGQPLLGERAGRRELTIDLDVREGLVTRKYLARCQEQQQAAEGSPLPPAASSPRDLLKGRRERRVFRFDGSRFVPVPAASSRR